MSSPGTVVLVATYIEAETICRLVDEVIESLVLPWRPTRYGSLKKPTLMHNQAT